MPIHLSSLPKPKQGTACNSCGYCCSVQPCQIANEFLGSGTVGPCPALELNTETGLTGCGMLIRPLHYLLARETHPEWSKPEDPQYAQAQAQLAGHVANALGAGLGCDSVDDIDSAQWPWPVMLHQPT